MTELEELPEEVRAGVLAARAAQEKASREAAQTQAAVKKEYEPMWARMAAFSRYADEIGVGYTLALTPRASNGGQDR